MRLGPHAGRSGESLGDSLGMVSWGRTWGWVAVLKVNFIPREALCPLGQRHDLPALARAMSGKWSVLCSGPGWADLEDSYVGSFSHWGIEPCKEPGRGAKRKELRFLQWWTLEGELGSQRAKGREWWRKKWEHRLGWAATIQWLWCCC